MPLRSRLVWKTERMHQYVAHVADDMPSTVKRIAKDAGDVLQDRIQKRTPVEKNEVQGSLGPKVPGKLRASIKRKEIETLSLTQGGRKIDGRFLRVGHVIYIAPVETDVDYAPYVEHDTGKYRPGGTVYQIAPRTRRALAFMGKDGQLHIVARVYRAPGSVGRHMFARGVASMTEATIKAAAEPALAEWRARHEKAEPRR